MIDLTEQLMTLRSVPDWLAEHGIKPNDGRPLTFRWVESMVARGYLDVTPKELFRVRYTSVEAIDRMVERLCSSYGVGRQSPPEVIPLSRKSKGRRAESSAKAGKHCEAVGW